MEQELMGINERNQELINQFNDRRFYILADDKCMAKNIMENAGIACPKTYGVVTHLSEMESGLARSECPSAIGHQTGKKVPVARGS